MNILLIEQVKPKGIPAKPLERMLLTMFCILPSLYPRRLAAITPKNHTITIINERYHEIPFDTPFDLVLIHFNTASAFRAYRIADTFKRKKIPVVLSGLHATALPDEALLHADSVLCGHGEFNWLTLLHDKVHNGLKTLYPPEPIDQYSHPIPPTTVTLPGFQLTGALESTRGCPYHCSFCPESQTPNGQRVLLRPVEEVIKEIQLIPQKTLLFYDLTLTANPTYTKTLFAKMKLLRKKFFCNGNVNVLATDEELVRLSHEAGCIAWLIGFESFTQQALTSVKKTTNKIVEYKKAIDLIHSYRMAVIGDFMFGFDADTIDVFETTLAEINALHIDAADFTILTPFPGTPIFEALKKENRLLTQDWDQYTMHSVVFKPKQMTPKELMVGVMNLHNEFYNPLQTIKRSVRGARYGIFPLLLLLNRNMISAFNRKNLRHAKKIFTK